MDIITTISSFRKGLEKYISKNPLPNKKCKSIVKSSLYVLIDTQLALDLYKEKEIIVKTQSNWLEEKTKNYILIYGVLQALYIQQDAIINICRVLKIFDKSMILENKDLSYIRNLRNSCTGHPSNNYDSSNNFISQTSVSQYSFSYARIIDNGSEVIQINILDLIKMQNKNVNSILKKILSNINKIN